VLAARIERHGPVSFETVVEVALYDPEHGFFSRGGAAGRRHGDFITSPEVGPLFGAVIARMLDSIWRDLGEPDPFTVVECGAGTGTLARTVRAAAPACSTALTYVLVERSPALRAHHHEHLSLSASHIAGGDGRGPRFVSLEEPPAGPVTGIVLANELLDNVPFRLVERQDESWFEVRVGADVAAATFSEHLVPAPDAVAELATKLVPDAPGGARVPIQTRASDWVRDRLAHLERGRLVVIDYVATTDALARRPMHEWVRTYRDHEEGTEPLEDIGAQDITVEVCVDQLARVRAPDHDRPQAEFLREHGIVEMVDEGKRIWHDRAHIGDLDAIRGRSRVGEAEALTDPAGLGSFRVLEWFVGP
jgi:SAM-dependent MidA family methyltransferase